MTKIKKALLSVLCCFALIFCSAFVFTACTRADMTAYNITIDEAIQSGWVKVIGDPIAGEEITIVLNPGTGYEIVPGSLKVNGKEIVGNKFIMPEGNVNVTAKFKKINYAVNTGNIEHGTVDIEVSAQEIASGDSTEWGAKVTLTPVPEKGYECTGITVLNNGVQVLVTREGNKWSFTMPQGNITIDATFSKVAHTLTKQTEHGSFTIPATASYGDIVEVTGITPDPGYLFSKIIVNGNTITGTSFKMPDSNTTVQVVFEAVEYTVSIADNVKHANIRLLKSGSSHYSTSLKAYYDDTITVSVTPDAGYTVSAIKVNGTAISGNSFVVKGDSVVTVELTANQYSITVGSSENGSVIPNKTTAIVGELITLTISPNATYNIETLTIKNGDLNVLGTIDGNTATFTMPAGNVTISATFASEGFAINIVSYEGSNIYANRVAVAEGTKVYIVEASVDAEQLGLGVYICLADPQPGYEFSDSGASLYWAGGDLMGAVQMEQGPNGEDLAYFEMPAGEVTLDFECRKKTAYQITKGETTNGSFDLSANSAYEGDYITITVHPAEGYELDEVYVNGNSHYQNLGFTMQGSDITVRVTFKKATYTITREGTTEHGYFDVQREAKYGEEVVITEQNTETGYEAVFTVTCNGTLVTVTGNKFIMPAGNVTISVSHTLISYSISVYESIEGNIENGSVSFDPTIAKMGDEITITVTPNDSYSLKAISVLYDANNDGNYQTLIPAKTANENKYVFTMIPYDVKIRAWFGIKNSITANEATNGTVEITGVTSELDGTFTANATEAFDGDTVTITTTPSAGFVLKSLQVNNGAVATTETSTGVFTFAMPTEAVSVTAEYEGAEYTITKNPTTNGSFDVKGTAKTGETVTITVTPATGYELDQILVDGEAISGNSFTMPANNVAVSVTFKAINYTITKNTTTNGSFDVKGTAKTGETVTITVAPATGYELDQILVDGVALEVGVTSFTMPANNVAVSVTFKAINYTITKNITGDGVVNVKDTATYGENVTVTATANTGYVFKSLKINNGAVETTETSTGVYTFVMPAGAVQVDVEFGYYVLTASDIEYTTSGTDLTITKVTTDQTSYEIPSTFNIDGTTYSVTAIGNGTTTIDSDIVDLILPNTLKNISVFTFSDCTGLTSITIPSSVTSIGNSAFSGCTGLTSIVVAAENTNYNSGNGANCIIETATNTLIAGCKTTVIPSSVTSIGMQAFYGCTGLTSITIPNSVTSIGNKVFYGCTGLTSIVVAEGNTKYNSGNGANCIIETATNTLIAGCKTTVIPSSVTSIGGNAFNGCVGLTSIEIPKNVTNIGGGAFKGCTGLTSVIIPNNVTRIETSAFSTCTNLSEVQFGSGLQVINQLAFAYCSKLENVVIPDNVTALLNSAFANCQQLKSIRIGKNVASIGKTLFAGCINLESIIIDSNNSHYNSGTDNNCIIKTSDNTLIAGCKTTIIPNTVVKIDSAFSGCKSLLTIVIPDSVTSIGDFAFSGCTGLTLITISEGVTSIGNYAFRDCTGLTSITISNSVTSISKNAFANTYLYNNANDGDLIYVSRADGKRWLLGYKGIAPTGPLEIPSDVFGIAEYAFSDCTGLNSITISEGVTSIGKYAFQNCTGLTSITIPSSVTSIGESAFQGCTGLTSITISEGVTSIGGSAFYGCKKLRSIIIPNSVTSISGSTFANTYLYNNANDGDLIYALRADGKKWLLGYKGTKPTGSLEIPNDVVGIAGGAFSGCTGLTSITIPEGVTSIGGSAFFGCTGLTSITIPNSVTSIGMQAFYGCTGLTSITIPNSVTSIGNKVFYGCTGLTSIVVAEGNTKYNSGNGANCIIETATNTLIAGCKTTVIPSSVTSIGNSAFQGCTGLTSITIPSSVTSIGGNAFYGCYGLTSITIPSSVTSIGEYAFYGCLKLTSITFTDTTPPIIGDYILSNCTSLTTIYVPAGTKDAYITALGSSYASKIVEMEA